MHAFQVLTALAAAGPAALSTTQDKNPVLPLPVPDSLSAIGVQRARVANGPFSVPAMTANDTSDENGMKTFQQIAALPCVDCYITGFSYGLRYGDGPNGSAGADANIDTGIYLHHALLINVNQTDSTCSLGNGGDFQRMFGAGNERGYIDLTVNGTRKAGYYIAPDEIILVVAEIMNMQMDGARDIYVTATYDYILANETSTANKFVHATPVWLDIDGNCGSFTNGSEVAVPPGVDVFSYSMPVPWNPSIPTLGRSKGEDKEASKDKNYEVLVTASHLHDGAIQLDISKNGAVVCEGVTTYGGTPEYISQVPGPDMPGMPGMSMGPVPLTHISAIHMCYGVGTTNNTDQWSVTAHYNLTAHPGLETTDGLAKPIMGISLMFLVEV